MPRPPNAHLGIFIQLKDWGHQRFHLFQRICLSSSRVPYEQKFSVEWLKAKLARHDEKSPL